MTTTTLIVEILISGILTCLWLLLGIITAFSPGFLLGAAKNYPEAFAALAILLSVAAAYSFHQLEHAYYKQLQAVGDFLQRQEES